MFKLSGVGRVHLLRSSISSASSSSSFAFQPIPISNYPVRLFSQPSTESSSSSTKKSTHPRLHIKWQLELQKLRHDAERLRHDAERLRMERVRLNIERGKWNKFRMDAAQLALEIKFVQMRRREQSSVQVMCIILLGFLVHQALKKHYERSSSEQAEPAKN